MNLHTLLEEAADAVDTAVAPSTASADVLRGRRALLRRRARRGGLTGVAVFGAAAVLTFGGVLPGTSDGGGASVAAGQGIALVDYDGPQPLNFTVASVPDGWTIQGSDGWNMVIEPAGDPATAVTDYDDKLVVTTQRKAMAPPFDDGTRVAVGPAPGVVLDPKTYDEDPDSEKGVAGDLVFVDPASGMQVLVSYPDSLRWTPEQAAAFAAGVHVTGEQAAG